MSGDLQAGDFAAERQRMVHSQLRARGIHDERVLAAMARVPREEFVAGTHRGQAYEDHPLPIEEGQTLSQPYIVALMLQAVAISPSDTVLEVGTGSGYQTALLCEMVRQVYTVDRHASLAHFAESTLQRLGYTNVTFSVGDGSQGIPTRAPFDVIVVSAAAPRVPRPLFEQLREGGRMVIPVGPAQAQEVQLVRKRGGKEIVATLENCRFVPLIGRQGYVSGW